MSAFLASALEYAARGWYVLPLDPHSNKPALPRHTATTCDRTDPWCHTQHTGWQQRATVDPERICNIWTNGEFGVGIACGTSGILVIDTDTADHIAAEGALASLAPWPAAFPSTWTVSSPTGGLHRYFADSQHRVGTVGRLGGVSVRGVGDYVIAPPTATSHGRYITLITVPVAPLPDWLGHLLFEPRIPTPRSSPSPRWMPDRDEKR